MNKIAFFPMKRCNLRCAHCQSWAACGPESTEENWDPVIDTHLRAAWDLGYDWVGFSGGELTLKMDLLLTVVRTAHDLGAITSLVTNGWWGANPTLAGDVCNTLRLAGLNILKISYDSFHREFLAAATIQRAISVAKTFDFDDLIIYSTSDDSALSVSDKAEIESNRLYQHTMLYDTLTKKFPMSINMIPVVSWDNCVYTSCEGIPVGPSSEHYLGDLDNNTLGELLAPHPVSTTKGENDGGNS